MLKAKENSSPSRVVFKRSKYQHLFGGVAGHKGSIPANQSAPMHLVLTLDMRDPLVPLEFVDKSIQSLPLYYPLRYGDGGGEAQYRVVSDSSIELLHINGSEADDEEYPFMVSFPEVSFSLETIPYEQYRAVLMWEQGKGYTTSPSDERLCHELMPFLYLAPDILPPCGKLHWSCRNKKCDWFDCDAVIQSFARVSAVPTDDIEMFGEHGTDVEIYFSLCRKCGTIVAQNRCS